MLTPNRTLTETGAPCTVLRISFTVTRAELVAATAYRLWMDSGREPTRTGIEEAVRDGFSADGWRAAEAYLALVDDERITDEADAIVARLYPEWSM